MILKFATDAKCWTYHEADEVIIEHGKFSREDQIDTSCLIYTEEDEAKIANFKLRDNTRKQVFYTTGYLLNDKGDTINCI